MKSKFVVLGAVFALIAGGLVWVLAKGFGGNPHEVPFMLKGKPAPAFTLKKFKAEETVSLESLKGKPVVINFWSTWCGPCKLEQPVLDWASGQFGDSVALFGVAHEDTEENVLAYLRQTGSPYPQLWDPQSSVAIDYAIAGVPETYFIDKQGIIRHKHVGPIDPKTLMAQVRALQQ